MKIILNKPCSENWENMENDKAGKFCTKCSKTVQDFTDSSPDEIIQKTSTNKDPFGRFTSDQLDVDFVKSWLKVLLSSLLVSGAITFVDAQKADTLFQSNNENAVRSLQSKVTGLQINSFPPCAPSDSCYTIKVKHSRYEKGKIKPLIIINGKRASVRTYATMPYNKIKEIKVLRANDEGIEKYGKKGKNGVILVTLKE